MEKSDGRTFIIHHQWGSRENALDVMTSKNLDPGKFSLLAWEGNHETFLIFLCFRALRDLVVYVLRHTRGTTACDRRTSRRAAARPPSSNINSPASVTLDDLDDALDRRAPRD